MTTPRRGFAWPPFIMGKILARVVRRAARPLAAATSRNRPSPGQLPERACPAPTGWCSVDIPPTDCCRGRRPRRPADACAAVDAPGGINPSPTTDPLTAAHANPRAAYMPPLRCHINVIRAHSICARARLRRRKRPRADMESAPTVGVGVLDDPVVCRCREAPAGEQCSPLQPRPKNNSRPLRHRT